MAETELPRCPCPDHWPDWDGQDVDLSAHWVHEQPLRAFFNMPIGYESFFERQQRELEALGLRERWPRLALSHIGWFKGRLLRLLEVEEAPPPHHRLKVLPTPFVLRGRLHHGNVSTIREPFLALQRELLEAGRMPKELYLVYLTCPLCAERKGGEKILMLRRWEDSPRLKRRQQARRQSV